VPVHYEGWAHFTQGREALERAFQAGPDELRHSVRWLSPGSAVALGD
jgi:hypothetical protein